MGLGDLRRLQCRFEEAESLYTQVSRIAVAIRGPDSEKFGDIYTGFGKLYLSTARPREAAEMFQRSVSIFERLGASTDARVRTAQILMANAAAMQGHYSEAIAHVHRAYALLDSLPARGLFGMRSLFQTGGEVFRAARQYDSSLEYFDRMVAVERRFMENSLPFLTEGQRLQWLNTYPLVHSGLISLARKVQQPRFLESAYAMTVNAKGKAIDAALVERNIALCSGEERSKPILDEYLRVSTQLANLSYAQVTQSNQSLRPRAILSLEERRDSLELSLSHVCFQYSGPLKQTAYGSPELLRRIEPGGILWDIVRFCPTDTLSTASYGVCPCDDHYAVFVCNSSGVVGLHDVGRVVEIDSLVLALRAAVGAKLDEVYSPLGSNHEARIRSIATEITRRLPPLPAADSAVPRTLYVSPDGILGLLPFELLTLDSDRYLIDGYRISYLSSSRDLVNSVSSQFSNRQAVILAAPDFERAADMPAESAQKIDSAATRRKAFAGSLSACFGNGFLPLAQSGKEADAVAALLTADKVPVVVRRGQAATESCVRSLTGGPEILHIATHGFFCDKSGTDDWNSLRSPLLRSGLALAGANRTLRGESGSTLDDGILTAYEVSAMDLSNTDLVVLSACETGVGDITRSEGVLGLTRAFRRAGAKSVVMNLWQASDKVAGELVTELYRRWLGGRSKVDALRDAMLQAKARAKQRFGHTDPYLWCGFVLVGDSH
jgi:CHAT domain-containing protein/tetratricopeptide (TPR) repeat protein